MIVSRSHRLPGKQTTIWGIAEERYGGELLAVVDNVRGTNDERARWMKEVGIKSSQYYQLNVMIHFFVLEEDAMLYYLTWGVK